MKRAIPLLLALAACGRAYEFSGPAPAGALRCTLEHGLAAGYELVEGGVDAAFLRLAQRLPPAPGEARVIEPQPDLGDVVLRDAAPHPVENQIVVVEQRGRLTLTVLGLTDRGVRVGPGSNAEDQARTMLALCTASPPVFPDATGQQTVPLPGIGPG
jgi:hypothetical protein